MISTAGFNELDDGGRETLGRILEHASKSSSPSLFNYLGTDEDMCSALLSEDRRTCHTILCETKQKHCGIELDWKKM